MAFHSGAVSLGTLETNHVFPGFLSAIDLQRYVASGGSSARTSKRTTLPQRNGAVFCDLGYNPAIHNSLARMAGVMMITALIKFFWVCERPLAVHKPKET